MQHCSIARTNQVMSAGHVCLNKTYQIWFWSRDNRSLVLAKVLHPGITNVQVLRSTFTMKLFKFHEWFITRIKFLFKRGQKHTYKSLFFNPMCLLKFFHYTLQFRDLKQKIIYHFLVNILAKPIKKIQQHLLLFKTLRLRKHWEGTLLRKKFLQILPEHFSFRPRASKRRLHQLCPFLFVPPVFAIFHFHAIEFECSLLNGTIILIWKSLGL